MINLEKRVFATTLVLKKEAWGDSEMASLVRDWLGLTFADFAIITPKDLQKYNQSGCEPRNS